MGNWAFAKSAEPLISHFFLFIMEISLIPLDRFNWELYLHIALLETQKNFVPPILYSLAQAHFEKLTPLGINVDNEPVGFAMYGIFGGIAWINRLMIDKAFQGRGIGKRAVSLLIERLKKEPQCQEIRTSYAKNNTNAALLFAALGFQEINHTLAEEIVAVYKE